MTNCIYDDGSVLYVDDPAACPMTNNGADLVDATEIETAINVTTDPPAIPAAVWWAAAAAFVLLFVKRK